MKMQRYAWSCGAASVVNAFRCFGLVIRETEVIPVAGTIPPSKCKHCRDLRRMLEERAERGCKASKWKCSCATCYAIRRHFGADHLTASDYTSESRDNAWQWLHGSLLHGRVAILCLDSWHHWALAFATSVDRVVVFDPYPSAVNKAANGVHPLNKTDLMRRWWNARAWVAGERRLYAISMGRK
jgi:hypothetical protein